MRTLRILCEYCTNTPLAVAKPTDNGYVLINRCRWERVTPPEAPEERWKWWCPQCHRPRELRSARIAANLDDMERRGVGAAEI